MPGHNFGAINCEFPKLSKLPNAAAGDARPKSLTRMNTSVRLGERFRRIFRRCQVVPSIPYPCPYPAFTIYEPCGWHTRPMCAVTWRAERARGKFSSKSSKVSKPAQIGRILKTPKSRRLQTARISKSPFEAGEVARFPKVLKFVGAQNPRGTL